MTVPAGSICSIWSGCAPARPPDGRESIGAEACAAYGRESEPVSSRLGGSIVWRGRFGQTLIGPSGERWDRCFIAVAERRRCTLAAGPALD
jgi:hypothetical protein